MGSHNMGEIIAGFKQIITLNDFCHEVYHLYKRANTDGTLGTFVCPEKVKTDAKVIGFSDEMAEKIQRLDLTGEQVNFLAQLELQQICPLPGDFVRLFSMYNHKHVATSCEGACMDD